MKVAPRKATSGYRNGVGCVICELDDDKLQRMNAEIWNGVGERVRGYRAKGLQTYYALTGRAMDSKTVTRHAEHIEETWHEVTPDRPASALEIPVLPADYKSIVDRAAGLGAYAMSRIEQRVAKNLVDDRDLVTLAKLGVHARAQQEANRIVEHRPQTQVALIFGLASGHLAGDLPEHEVIDVTPEGELLDEVHAEREALAAIAGTRRRSAPAADAIDFDAIF